VSTCGVSSADLKKDINLVNMVCEEREYTLCNPPPVQPVKESSQDCLIMLRQLIGCDKEDQTTMPILVQY